MKIRKRTPESQARQVRTDLLLSHPFFGNLALRLDLVADETTERLACDGRTLSFNPEWIDSATSSDAYGCMAARVLACALKHHTRRGDRDGSTWNRASAYAIAPLLRDAEVPLPPDAADPDAFPDMTVEQIYAALRQDDEGGDHPEDDTEDDTSDDDAQDDDQNDGGDGQDGDDDDKSDGDTSSDDAGDAQGDDGEGGDETSSPGQDARDGAGGAGEGGLGEVRDLPGDPTPSDIQENEREWDIATSQAERACLTQGTMPGGLASELDAMRKPALADWRTLLQRFRSQLAREDYSWRRPNRRFLHMGIHLPGLHSEKLPPIVWAIDTSGSMSQDTIDQCGAELATVVRELQPEAVHVVWCDAQVAGVDVITRPEDLANLTMKGRGGTDFRPPFEWVREQRMNPTCLIYLTDMAGTFPENAPPYPVLWIGCTALYRHLNIERDELPRAPFGQTIHIDA